MAKRIVFFGNERLGTGLPQVEALTLRALVAGGFEVVAVVTRPDKNPSDVETVARRHAIPVLSPGNRDELLQLLLPLQADAGVLIAFGLMVPDQLIDHFAGGIINIHPSRLPEYRGPTPVEAAILDGAAYTGVSIMQLAPKMDAGPVYVQENLEVPAGVSKFELATQLQALGADLLKRHLDDILEGRLKPTDQDESRATYTKLIKKSDGLIDWSKTAAQLEREIRAYLGWPGSRAELLGHEVAITEVSVVPADGATGLGTVNRNHGLQVGCGDGQALEITKLKPAGKSEMAAADWLRGLR